MVQHQACRHLSRTRDQAIGHYRLSERGKSNKGRLSENIKRNIQQMKTLLQVIVISVITTAVLTVLVNHLVIQ